MINCDCDTKNNIKEYNPNRPQTSDHPYEILITGGFGLAKNKRAM